MCRGQCANFPDQLRTGLRTDERGVPQLFPSGTVAGSHLRRGDRAGARAIGVAIAIDVGDGVVVPPEALAGIGLEAVEGFLVADTMEEKERGRANIFDAPLGLNVIQTMFPALLSEAIHRRGMPPSQFARITATNPARLYQFQGPGRPRRDFTGTRIRYNRRTQQVDADGGSHIGDSP